MNISKLKIKMKILLKNNNFGDGSNFDNTVNLNSK